MTNNFTAASAANEFARDLTAAGLDPTEVALTLLSEGLGLLAASDFGPAIELLLRRFIANAGAANG